MKLPLTFDLDNIGTNSTEAYGLVDADGRSARVSVHTCVSLGFGIERRPHGEAESDARFIVLAVNCHDELVAALEQLVTYGNCDRDTILRGQAALAKAVKA